MFVVEERKLNDRADENMDAGPSEHPKDVGENVRNTAPKKISILMANEIHKNIILVVFTKERYGFSYSVICGDGLNLKASMA